MKKGTFVKVGDDVGVIVTVAFEDQTPEEHVGIWFGEKDVNNIPMYRTVPEKYCKTILEVNQYH